MKPSLFSVSHSGSLGQANLSLTGLVEGGYRGPATYEICSPIRGGPALENLDACAATYLNWMQAHKL